MGQPAEFTGKRIADLPQPPDLSQVKFGPPIQLLNGNDRPVVVSSMVSILENSVTGTYVAQVTANAGGDASQSLTFAIVGGDEFGTFTIDSLTGEVRVANPAGLDYETISSFSLIIAATDDGSPALTGTGVLVVQLLEVNEFAPVLDDFTFTIPENTPWNTLVGQVVGSDGDFHQLLHI